jgi:hypothetical protein
VNEQQERALIEGLRALAAATSDASASPRVERAVLAAMRRNASPQRLSRTWIPLAAALLIATASGAWMARQVAPQRGMTIRPAGFVEIPGAGMLPPLESAAIIRVALPVAELPSYGIQIGPEIDVASVEADLLVAQDGHARAIRLVQSTDSTRSTP